MLFRAETFHLIALTSTLVVEATGMALWARFTDRNPRRAISVALLVNLVVHTLFWYSQPLFSTNWPLSLYGAEAVVVLLEGACYMHFLSLHGLAPWLLSFVLNLASFLFGLLLWQLLL